MPTGFSRWAVKQSNMPKLYLQLFSVFLLLHVGWNKWNILSTSLYSSVQKAFPAQPGPLYYHIRANVSSWRIDSGSSRGNIKRTPKTLPETVLKTTHFIPVPCLMIWQWHYRFDVRFLVQALIIMFSAALCSTSRNWEPLQNKVKIWRTMLIPEKIELKSMSLHSPLCLKYGRFCCNTSRFAGL